MFAAGGIRFPASRRGGRHSKHAPALKDQRAVAKHTTGCDLLRTGVQGTMFADRPRANSARRRLAVELIQAFSGLLVGVLVGFTGVGGGSLMAPIMILLLGVAPVTAVGTDLWFAGITKLVGGTVHHSRGNADLKIVKWLCVGSIPFALVTLFVLSLANTDQIKHGIVTQALGAVLLLTAIATFYRRKLHRLGERLRLNSDIPFKPLQVPLTIT